jgi:hypothetical protein
MQVNARTKHRLSLDSRDGSSKPKVNRAPRLAHEGGRADLPVSQRARFKRGWKNPRRWVPGEGKPAGLPYPNKQASNWPVAKTLMSQP